MIKFIVILTAAERRSKNAIFYKLLPSDTVYSYASVDPSISAVIASCENNALDLAEFYTACLNAMLVGSSLDRAKKENMTAFDSCAIHYHLEMVWSVLGLLPPPPAFLLQMTGNTTRPITYM